MPMKAIDKSSSPLWVRILVWILVAGLVAGTLVIAVATIVDGWTQEEVPMQISAEDLPPEILQQLEAQMAEEAAANQFEDDPDLVNEDNEDGEDTVPESDAEGDQDE